MSSHHQPRLFHIANLFLKADKKVNYTKIKQEAFRHGDVASEISNSADLCRLLLEFPFQQTNTICFQK